MVTVLKQPVAVQPGTGRELPHLGVTHLLTGAQTGGAYYVCQAIFGPQGGSPLHIHHHEDEVIYVLAGELEVRLDNNRLQLPTGGVIHLPKKFPHALYNPLGTPLKLMIHAIPGGLEGYFDEVESALQAGTFDDAQHASISVKYGLEWLE